MSTKIKQTYTIDVMEETNDPQDMADALRRIAELIEQGYYFSYDPDFDPDFHLIMEEE